MSINDTVIQRTRSLSFSDDDEEYLARGRSLSLSDEEEKEKEKENKEEDISIEPSSDLHNQNLKHLQTSSTTSSILAASNAPTRHLNLQRGADYLIQQSYTLDTQSHQDHTFCGIMFDVTCKGVLPIEYIEISSVWVRGMNVCIYVCKKAGTYISTSL